MENTYTDEEAQESKRIIASWIAKLLQAYMGYCKKINQLDDLLPDAFTEYFGTELDQQMDVILTMCGVPENGTPFDELEIDTSKLHPSQIEYGFYRDGFYEDIYNMEHEDLEYTDFLKYVYELMGLK